MFPSSIFIQQPACNNTQLENKSKCCILVIQNKYTQGYKYDKYRGVVASKYYITKSENELSDQSMWASGAPVNVSVLSKIWNH